MFKLKTGPTVEPLSSTEAKLHLKIDPADTTDDTLVTALIKAAREMAENYTGRALINQTWEYSFSDWPHYIDPLHNYIELMPSQLSSITSITYKDVNGATQTLASTGYEADTYNLPGRVCLKFGKVWPVAQYIQNAILITFVAGYGTDGTSVPGPIKSAILLIIGHLYENREDVIIGRQVNDLPKGAEYLLNPYRVIQF